MANLTSRQRLRVMSTLLTALGNLDEPGQIGARALAAITYLERSGFRGRDAIRALECLDEMGYTRMKNKGPKLGVRVLLTKKGEAFCAMARRPDMN